MFAATSSELRASSLAWRQLPWMRCGGLLPDGFDALGDALGSVRPSRDSRTLGGPVRVSLEGRASLVRPIAVEVQNALAETRDPNALGRHWSDAFRLRRAANDAAAFATSYGSQRPLPPDAELLRPYFSGLALELIELARTALATNRALYIHHPAP